MALSASPLHQSLVDHGTDYAKATTPPAYQLPSLWVVLREPMAANLPVIEEKCEPQMQIVLRPYPFGIDSIVGVHTVRGNENTVG